MAWIETAKGDLLNLDKISNIEMRSEGGGNYYLIAWESVGESSVEHNNLIQRPATKEQAEEALAAIKRLLGAKKLSDLSLEQRSGDIQTLNKPGA